MRRHPRALASAVILLVCLTPPAWAGTCEIPLIVGSAGATANVLLLIDNSGSMNEAVCHSSYNKNTTYSGRFTATDTYYVTSDGTYTPRSFDSRWTSTPSAYLVDSDGGEDGRYFGNYLNWVFYNATAAQRAAIPTVTKIQAAKTVVTSLLTTMTNCRFAIERLNYDAGGTVIAPFGTDLATMTTAVNAIVANTWTPLAEALVTALDYFKTTGTNAPFQASCQKSFVILVTDGLPTYDTTVPTYLKSNDCGNNDAGASCTSLGTGYPNSNQCSAYMDNVSCYMYRNDLRGDLDQIQNVATFVIGFTVNAPLLQKTADVGGGDYYTTDDVTGLATALGQAFVTIAKRVAAGTSVSVVSAEDRINNRLFRARYESQSWRGYIEAFDLPFHAGTPALWESGALLASRDPGTRTLLTSTTGTNLYGFTADHAAALVTLLGAADATEATNIINYVRGNAIEGTRDREGWILGDIVDASPLAIGKPTGFSSLPGYAAFRSAHATRGEVLYVGGNDGMLHCIDTTDGTELWAYIPKSQLGRLKNLMQLDYCHEYFVNATPAAYDLLINGAWKTVVFGGENGKTNGMFALDVTDPTNGNQSILWDVEVRGLRGSMNTPTLIRDRTRDASVLCVGTGYTAAATADSLLAIDPATGALLFGVRLGSAVAGNKTTRATSIDTDLDGYDDVLYIGDLAGRLWRVNLRTNPWTVTQLFSCSQPIQAAPVVTINSVNRPMVFFGTGQFISATDPTSTTVQAIYAVVDDGTGTTFTAANLVNQTSTINGAGAGHGWYIQLTQATGERVTRTAALVAGTLFVTSFCPRTDACSGGGQSWLYSLDYKDGSAPDNANGSAHNTTDARVQSMGDGVLADPTVDMLNETVLFQSSNAVVMSENIIGGLKKIVVHGWRQKWH
jgi:type IV pilus assembly protein PilY1